MEIRRYQNKWGHNFRIIGFDNFIECVQFLVDNPNLYFNTSAHGFAEMHFNKRLSQQLSSIDAPFLIDGIWSLAFFRPLNKSIIQIPGWDLIAALLPKLNEKCSSVHVIWSSEDIIFALKEMYPLIRWSYYSGIVEQSADLSSIKNVNSFCTLVALGSPKQDTVALRLSQELKDNQLIIPVGIALAMHVGVEKKVPAIYTRLGLSWLHRFIQKPLKMTKRIVQIIRFLIMSKTLFNVVPSLRINKNAK